MKRSLELVLAATLLSSGCTSGNLAFEPPETTIYPQAASKSEKKPWIPYEPPFILTYGEGDKKKTFEFNAMYTIQDINGLQRLCLAFPGIQTDQDYFEAFEQAGIKLEKKYEVAWFGRSEFLLGVNMKTSKGRELAVLFPKLPIRGKGRRGYPYPLVLFDAPENEQEYVANTELIEDEILDPLYTALMNYNPDQ